MNIDLEPAVSILRRELPSLAGVYVFGSVAAGTALPDSDVDLAFHAGRAANQGKIVMLREMLSAALRRDVDLVDLAAAPTTLQMQVLREGRLLAAQDAFAIGMFELRVLRDYHDLKIRRAVIEADIVRRGRVHA